VSAGLPALLDRFGQVSILCLGDLMLDRFVYGAVDRVSPEAPVPVVRQGRVVSAIGGVGNVAGNLAALGARVGLVGVVGRDAEAAELESLLAKQDIAARLVADGERPTTLKTRFVAESQQMLRVDRELAAPLAGPVERDVSSAVLELVDTHDAVVISDYAKGALTPEVLRAVIGRCRERAIPVFVDPKGNDFTRYRGATLVTPNAKELAAVCGHPLEDDEAFVEAAMALVSAHDFHGVLATRGSEGMTLVVPDGAVTLPARAREVYDVSGAGDTVIAAFAAARAAGGSWADAAYIANGAAGLAVEKIGTAVVEHWELRAAIERELHAGEAGKVVSLSRALGQIERWRSRGLKIGFTNGCFDLLHPGHLSVLEQAGAACDRLVVGLNSDASVKRLKGPERPVQNEWARSLVLASLSVVDAVVLFDGDTPLPELEAIRPDVLIKGADYSEAQVVGGDLVKSYGGRVHLAPLLPGHSTTRTIEKLANGALSGAPAKRVMS